jgi:hypothetical protein
LAASPAAFFLAASGDSGVDFCDSAKDLNRACLASRAASASSLSFAASTSCSSRFSATLRAVAVQVELVKANFENPDFRYFIVLRVVKPGA